MIRHADLKDFGRVIELMTNFANAAPIDALHQPDYSVRRLEHLLARFKSNGCVIVAEDKEGVIQGVLIGVVFEDLWLPYVKTLKEVAWWVEPEYRNTSMGYRLLMEYVKFGNDLINRLVVSNFTLTNMSISPDFDLEKRGWRPIETNYVYEGRI